MTPSFPQISDSKRKLSMTLARIGLHLKDNVRLLTSIRWSSLPKPVLFALFHCRIPPSRQSFGGIGFNSRDHCRFLFVAT